MNSSQIFDLVVIGALLYCAWKGAARGLVSQAAWVLALILCFKFSGELAPAIEPAIAVDQPLKRWIAMAIVYLGLCLGSFVAASILDSWLVRAKLKDFDRHLGALLGLIKGAVICMTVMFFSLTLSQSSKAVVSQTRSAYAAAVLLYHLDPLIPLIPEGAKETVENVRRTFNQELGGDEALTGGTTSPREVFDDWQGGGSSSGESGSGGGSGFRWQDLWGNGNASDDGLRPGGGSDPSNGTSELSLQDLLKSLPAQIRDDLTRNAVDTFLKSSSEQKQRLLRELQSTVPENAAAILSDFVRSAPATGQGTLGSVPVSARTELSRQNSVLLDQIAGIYGDRRTIVTRTTEFLAGVPEDVQRRVLEDWHADVMLLQNDPDPGTDVASRLDERILRQLSRSGIALEHLDRELRLRLSQSVR